MNIEDVAVADIAERWYGSRGPGEVLPASVAWLPDRIRRQYSTTSPLLWRKRSLFPVETPRQSHVDAGKMVFMSFDEGELVWAFDVNHVDHYFDHGPDSDAIWKAVDSSLAGLMAQRTLLEIALGPISWRWISVIPGKLLPDVVGETAEVDACQWQAFPGLRICIGDGILVVARSDFAGPALSAVDKGMLKVTVAAMDRDKLDYVMNRA